MRAGQVLAEAQSTDLGRARAEHDAAEARVTLARSALERKRALADRIVPRREVQEAEADLAAALAELRAASATLQALGAVADTRRRCVAPAARRADRRNRSSSETSPSAR